MHYHVIYTKTRDNADEVIAQTYEFVNKDDAIALFKERINKLMAEVLENKWLESKFSIFKHKALIKIEGTHYCVALVSDEDMMK